LNISLKKARIECIYDLIFKRASYFILSLTFYPEPAELVGCLKGKTYVNDRLLNTLTFFDTSRSYIWKACITNSAKHYSENWHFDWVRLTIDSFKENLCNQCRRHKLYEIEPQFNKNKYSHISFILLRHLTPLPLKKLKPTL